MTKIQADDELRDSIRNCFTDSEMGLVGELELFDTDETIDNLMQLINSRDAERERAGNANAYLRGVEDTLSGIGEASDKVRILGTDVIVAPAAVLDTLDAIKRKLANPKEETDVINDMAIDPDLIDTVEMTPEEKKLINDNLFELL